MSAPSSNQVVDCSLLVAYLHDMFKEMGEVSGPVPGLDWKQFEAALQARLAIPPEKGVSKYEPVEFYALILACFFVIEKFSPGDFTPWKLYPAARMDLEPTKERQVQEYYRTRWGNILGGINYLSMNTTAELEILKNDPATIKVLRGINTFRQDSKVFSRNLEIDMKNNSDAIRTFLGTQRFFLLNAIFPMSKHAVENRLLARSKTTPADRFRLEQSGSYMTTFATSWVHTYVYGLHDPTKANPKYAADWYKGIQDHK